MARLAFPVLFAAAVLISTGCGSDARRSDATAASTPSNVVAELTTTVLVVVAPSEPQPVAISAEAADLLGLWRYAAVDGDDVTLLDNLSQGFLRVDAPIGIGLSIGTFRAIDPNDFVCSGTAGSGGALEVRAGTLRITRAYETPAVECPQEIGPVPIVDAVGACVIAGCPYEVVDGRLRLTVSDGVTAVLDRL